MQTSYHQSKVAELIRKDIPFAVLLPLSLINEIDSTGKTSIDEAVRIKTAKYETNHSDLARSRMAYQPSRM